MSEPFSVQRAVAAVSGDIMRGKIDDDGFITAHGGHFFKVKTPTTHNTGLVDHDGKEIFTGDKLRHFSDPCKQMIIKEVEFLTKLGGFCLKFTLNSTFFKSNHSTFAAYPDWVEQTQIVHEHLTQDLAQQYLIVGNIYSDKIEPLPKDEVFDHDY